MKYILKKPLPGIEVGTIFEFTKGYDGSVHGVTLVKGENIGGLLDFIEGFGIDDDFFEEVKESKVWKPEKGEKYWYIYADGSIDEEAWDHGLVDNGRLAYGNIYKTEEEAIKARDKQLAIVRLRNYLIENDMLCSDEDVTSASRYAVFLSEDIFYIESYYNVFKYIPYGYINSYKNCEQFIKDCESDLCLIFLP